MCIQDSVHGRRIGRSTHETVSSPTRPDPRRSLRRVAALIPFVDAGRGDQRPHTSGNPTCGPLSSASTTGDTCPPAPGRHGSALVLRTRTSAQMWACGGSRGSSSRPRTGLAWLAVPFKQLLICHVTHIATTPSCILVRMAELDSQPKTLQTIYTWYSQDKLFVNRRYQRKLVWTLPEKQKLVESVLSKLPIPAVLMSEREGGGYEIIDGLQRLHSLMSFIEQGFPTERGKFFDTARFLTTEERRQAGLFWTPGGDSQEAADPDVRDETAEKDADGENAEQQAVELLDSSAVSQYLDYPLSISIMRGASAEEVDEVFGRINTYGHQLSDQERRQAGVQGDFPRIVRELATELRGDVSSDVLNLAQMPMISIDLPKMKHGYAVQADQVFWVRQGVLNGGNLRDSLDEQCIADILASIVGGKILARSKEALDKVYDRSEPESEAIAKSLDSYGSAKLKDEFKFCVQEVLNITASNGDEKLRKVLFKGSSNNPFPNVFALLLIGIHEVLISEKHRIANYAGVKKAPPAPQR